MGYDSELVHIIEDLIIVKVVSIDDNGHSESALGQGTTVYEAEDNAIKRLTERFKSNPETPLSRAKLKDPTSLYKKVAKSGDQTSLPQHNSGNPVAQNDVPVEDWSKELDQLDTIVKRLGWDRESENIFLSKILGVRSRNRITDHYEMLLAIEMLSKLNEGANPEDINRYIERDYVINSSNNLLSSLDWNTEKARTFLFEKFNVNSRSELDIKQLLLFNLMLSRHSN
ncbi:hypothetical protein [Prochlorococcus sp. MIT 0601]|uniref:hypothetical protein n=1 Tax=Prochlorococcus sp. MIT 0601 TaxID=1499498 RepID=UPI00053384E3|nr:hypothetical protein [Prochlorococcus sp. MIT 0601]KGG12420.1 hypothetical protein EV05_1632 [Prochlorococcus sp. MIT 0601]